MQRYPYHGTGVRVQALNRVTPAEMEALEATLRRGYMPVDLVAKLERLRTDDPREFYLRQQSLTLGWVLTSLAAQAFCHLGPRECERLLRMLAYVRKEEDAIPDTWEGGMTDDHDLMRLTCTEFRAVLDAFKAWRLTHQVPALWHGEPNQPAGARSTREPAWM